MVTLPQTEDVHVISRVESAYKPSHQVRADPSFCSMKRLGLFVFPSGWDASPLQGYSSIKVASTHFVHLRRERHSVIVLSKNTKSCPRLGLKSEQF